jgi:hypothetical protein
MHGLIAAVGSSYWNFIKYAKVWEQGLRADPDLRPEGRQKWWPERGGS